MAAEQLGGLEVALYGLCLGAALLIGAAHPPTQVGVAAAALVLFLAVGRTRSRDKGLRLTPLAWVMGVALGWTALQLVPLPPAVLALVSPRAAELRAETGGGWAPISLDVAATTIELCKQLGYIAAFVVAVELLRSRAATRRAAAVVAGFGVLIAVSTVLHRAFHVTKIFGVYAQRDWPGMPFFAPFVNPNHAASVLALAALAAFGLGAATTRGARLAWIAAGAISTVTLLATTSRGGAVALALGALLLIGLLASAHFGRVRGVLLAVGIMAVLGAGTWLLADGLRTRVLVHASGESNFSNQKTRGWLVAAKLAGAYPLVGVGRGAFEAPATAFRVVDEHGRQVYAEDVALQVLSEWGTPIALGLALWALMLWLRVLGRVALDAELSGLACAIVAVVAHGFVDCGFEYPGVMMPFLLALGAVVARAESEERSKRRPRPRLRTPGLVGAGLVGTAIVLLGWSALDRLWWTESKRLRVSLDANRPPSAEVVDAIVARHPAAAELELLAGEAALRRGDGRVLGHLGRAMRLDPPSSYPHHLAAIELARRGHVSQAALELRLAIERGAQIAPAELVKQIGDRAVDAVPRTSEALANLGTYLASERRWDAADEAFRRALAAGGGAKLRAQWVGAFANAPAERRIALALVLVEQAASGDELALALHELVALGEAPHAVASFEAKRTRFPGSGPLLVEGARARAADGDLDGARRMLRAPKDLDAHGQLLVGELTLELAERAGDADAVAAARARLALLRAKADLDQPLPGGTK